MKPHQSVWLIPGLFGAAGPAWPTPNVTAMAANDESLVEKLSAYWAWADTEPNFTVASFSDAFTRLEMSGAVV